VQVSARQGAAIYLCVCAVLGYILIVGHDTDHRLGTQDPVFAAGARELALDRALFQNK